MTINLFAEIQLVFFLIAGGLLLVFACIVLVSFWSMAGPWFQAMTGGRPIPLIQIVGMRLRKINPRHIIPHGIAAAQTGCPIQWNELESAYLQGADIETVVTAFIASSKKGDTFTFEEVVNAERDSRLQELLDQ